jgi:hypothetical protein
MFNVPEKCRITSDSFLASNSTYGNNGAFAIPLDKDITAFVIASDGMGWEHVSVHIEARGKNKVPTWDQMCRIKGIFWSDEDCVIQYHPPRSQYINCHEHTLHLWRPRGVILPIPPSIMIGPKQMQHG